MTNSNNLKRSESDNENNDARKVRWWITTKCCGWFKNLRTKSGIAESEQKWDYCIYFDTFEEADKFEKDLKQFILEKYPRAKEEGWFDEDKAK